MRSEGESSGPFLAMLGRALKTRDGIDAGLAGIVAEHILVAVPAEDCVETAMAEIETLAEFRAAALEANADG